MIAALARGIGWRSASEQADFLMQDAPDDLYEAARARLLDPRTYPAEEIARRERLLEQTIADLNAPLHPNCYLSPTQFAEKFGLDLPGEAMSDGDKRGAKVASGHSAPSSSIARLLRYCRLILWLLVIGLSAAVALKVLG